MIIGTTKIEKVFDDDGELDYTSFKDLEDPDYEYRELADGLGTKVWLRRGEYHSYNDSPAEIRPIQGVHSWYRDGILHRDGDKPAMIYYSSDGKVLHRIWMKNGKRHRGEDKPAEIVFNGNLLTWYKHGRKHRENGPAFIDNINGIERWYIDGIEIQEKSKL